MNTTTKNTYAALEEADRNSDKKFLQMRQAKPQTLQETLADLPMVGETIADFTPVVGDIKAATELPEDMRMARDLIEQGYEEGDIVDMGLGGGLAALSIAGFIPAGGAVADVVKKGVKETAKERLGKQTQDALITPKRAEQLERAKELPASERRAFLKQANRPTPKVFHGAKTMSLPREEIMLRYQKLRTQYNNQYLKDPVRKVFSDKESGLIASRGISADDFVSKAQPGNIQIPVGTVDGEVDTIPLMFKKEGDKLNAYAVDTDTMQVLDEDNPISSMDILDGKVNYDEVEEELLGTSVQLSATSDMLGEKRIDIVEREGFQPYDAFKSEVGMAGRTGGEHSELKKKMLSTSRDPLVAMKPSFGGMDTGNVVYADLPPELTRDMTPMEYKRGAGQVIDDEGNRVRELPELEAGQIGYRLPKSIHLEGEEAIAMPENLDVKALEKNPELAAKVQRGQDMVKNIMGKADTVLTDVQYPESPAGKRQIYNRVKETLKNLQSLGQYTEQYGARGTYDDLLEGLLDENDYSDLNEVLFRMPELRQGDTEMAKNMSGLNEVMKRIKQQSMQGSTGKGKRQLRNVPDELIRKVVYGGGGEKVTEKQRKLLGDSGVNVYFDGTVDLSELGYNDLKKILMIGTQKFNRGGLASRK